MLSLGPQTKADKAKAFLAHKGKVLVAFTLFAAPIALIFAYSHKVVLVFERKAMGVWFAILVTALLASQATKKRWPTSEKIISFIGWGGAAWGAIQLLVVTYIPLKNLAATGAGLDVATSTAAAVAVIVMAIKEIYGEFG